MKIVEIGCGDKPGPLLKQATEYYAVDPSEDCMRRVAENNPGFIPMIADAANLDMLKSGDIDIVLARNVFGDPFLGGDRETALNIQFGEVSAEQRESMRMQVIRKKLAIASEAARILNEEGRLVVIDSYTPEHTKDFIDTTKELWRSSVSKLSSLERVDLQIAVPELEQKSTPGVMAWVAYRDMSRSRATENAAHKEQ